MKVGIYTGTITPTEGGGFTYLDSILEAFESLQQHEIIILGYVNHRSGSLPYHRLSNPSLLRRMAKKLKNKGRSISNLQVTAEILEIDLIWFPIYEMEEVSIPYVMTVWDVQHRVYPFFPEFQGAWRNREKRLLECLPRASFIVTGTEYGKRQLEKLYNIEPGKAKVIPFATPSDCLRKSDFVGEIDNICRFNLPKEYFIFPAQFWAHKNHIAIIKALAILRDRGKKCHVVFTGAEKGNWESLKQRIEKRNLESQVHNLGFVNRDELIELYLNSSGLIFPSLFGPDNIPPLEAMALRKPVLTGDIPGVRDQLQNNAVYFDTLAPQDLANKVESLLENGPKNDRIENAKKFAAKLDTEMLAKKINGILDSFSPYLDSWKEN